LPVRHVWAAPLGAELHAALVNGVAGMVITERGLTFPITGFTVADCKIIEIDAIAPGIRSVASAP